ncbi:MAG: alpha-L-fucosidase [Chloroflexota bacterium]|nr:alpha-L-fucosidase [Chloroflexota bacterium]
MTTRYEPNWRSLRQHQTPRWFTDAKFGIYTHWGIYCVPAWGPNATWYPYRMYREGEPHYAHHVKTYGHPSEFGYKDFIPDFNGAKFDADAWADLFRRAGAQFAGPVAEHHDGFALWDSAHTEWNAARMGPKRDVVGELAEAVRRQGMRYMVAMHHAENWWFFPHWRSDFDTSDPRYAGLYGEPHNLDFPLRDVEWDEQDKPSRAFLDTWKAKLVEVVDKYEPDYIWFDFGLKAVHEQYKQDFLAYYYNKEAEWNRGVVVTYKWDNLPPGVGVLDIELGKMPDQAYHEWITDTTVDDGSGWGYLRETTYKSATELVQYLVDNVSKNGLMLLNVGPKPDGTIPDEAVSALEGIGDWLRVNGEAIYGTTPWWTYGEGPTEMSVSGAFSDTKEKLAYQGSDIRFTVKRNVLYAICLDWPEPAFTIESLNTLYPGEIRSVELLGNDGELAWRMTAEGLEIERPERRPCDSAYAFKITRNTSM